MSNSGLVEIGSFNVTSGKVIVTDPCYDKIEHTDRLAGVLKAKNGKWMSRVLAGHLNMWGKRNYELQVWHEDYKGDKVSERQNFLVAVDSGQVGVFDHKNYPLSRDDDEDFYSKICDLTLGSIGAGCVDFGVASSSGVGDGAYACYVAKENNEAVEIRIVFIGDEEDEDEESDDDSFFDDFSEDDEFDEDSEEEFDDE